MRSFFEEFKKFILRGSVVDLAVGIVIGTAFSNIVNALVADIFMPLVGFVTGGVDISGQKLVYKDVTLAWGHFLQTIINFLLIGFCMFLVVKGVNALHKYVLEAEAAKAAEPTATEKLLAEIRDLLKQGAPAAPAAPQAAPAAPPAPNPPPP
jgi:large conductance mechanosensitive channel